MKLYVKYTIITPPRTEHAYYSCGRVLWGRCFDLRAGVLQIEGEHDQPVILCRSNPSPYSFLVKGLINLSDTAMMQEEAGQHAREKIGAFLDPAVQSSYVKRL